MKFTAQATITILDDDSAITSFQRDLEQPGDIYGWMYLLTTAYAEKLFAQVQAPWEVNLIVDHRMKAITAELQEKLSNFHAWAWTYNRTMHDKTILFPEAGVTYIGTYNLTKGSYWMSQNKTVRIESKELTLRLFFEWLSNRRKTIKVRPTITEKEF